MALENQKLNEVSARRKPQSPTVEESFSNTSPKNDLIFNTIHQKWLVDKTFVLEGEKEKHKGDLENTLGCLWDARYGLSNSKLKLFNCLMKRVGHRKDQYVVAKIQLKLKPILAPEERKFLKDSNYFELRTVLIILP